MNSMRLLLLPTFVLLALLVPPAHAQTTTLVTRNATWRYFAAAAAPVGDWTGAGYDDSAWPQGPGVLGYGELYIATAVPFGGNTLDRWITTGIRCAFTVADAGAIEALVLNANYDDGFIAYLNGVELTRANLPAGPVDWTTWATAIVEGGAYLNVPLTVPPGTLQNGTNVLAIELHQRGPTSSDLVWDGELLATAVALSRGPYLQSATPTGITVRWRTNVPTGTRLDHGDAPGVYTTTVVDPALVSEHEVVLSGLAPGTQRYYAVGEPDALLTPPDATYAFRLAPAPGSTVPVRAWIVGDSGQDNLQSRAVRDQFVTWSASQPPDFWLMLGDNAYFSGTDGEYQSGCFGLFPGPMRNWPLYTTRGNHDLLYAGAGNDYYDHFTLPSAGEAGGVPSGSEAYYAFDWGPVHFVSLDSEGSDRTLGGPMIQWLRQDLAATTSPWIVCYWHHPPYTRGTHNSDNPLDSEGKMRDMRENVLPILDSTGVDLVLSGHSHVYERSYLLNGHYGLAASLTPAMKLGAGDGRADGDGPYAKAHLGSHPFEGTVYTVAGSSALPGTATPIPCMVTSLSAMGSLVLDVAGDRLDARFLDLSGAVRDSFTIVKGAGELAVPPRTSLLHLSAPWPNPSRGEVSIEFDLPEPGETTLDIVDASGRRVARLASGRHEVGKHRVSWRGALGRGRPATAGLYWAVLTSAGETRVKRVVLAP